MPAKKLTAKQKKENQLRAALRQRLHDVAVGAGISDVDGVDWWSFDLEGLRRFIQSVDLLFVDGDEKKHLTAHWNIDEYDSLDKTTDFLFRNGIRA